MFFRAYIQTSQNKKARTKFKDIPDEELYSYEEIKDFPDYAGILDNYTILIDIDDLDQSEILFKIIGQLNVNCRVYQTTRGKHFLFRNNSITKTGTRLTLAIGIKADVKSGIKNGYEVLKLEGVEREIIREVQGDEADLIPKWLYPINTKVDFLGMEEGEGRNQAMFNYILILQSNNFTKEEARECIRIINKFVLKTPLPDNELETVLRDDAFQKTVFFKKSAFVFDKFAMFMKSNSNICKINNQLHFYKDGIYVSGKKRIEAEMLKQIPQLNRAKRTEVYEYLDAIIQENTAQADANFIAFRNGIFNIAKDELLSFSPEYIMVNKINWDYNPNAKSSLVDDVFDKISCNDPDIRALLEEIAGYCFYRRNELGKSFILVGEKYNGKSTYLDMIKTMLGESNISALDLAEVNEKFSTIELFGKLANIGDDIGDEFIPNTGVFKKLVTGEALKGEHKGQDVLFFHSYAKLLFSANNIPRLGRGKDSSAVARRLIIVPFNAQFLPDDPNYNAFIKYDLCKQPAIEYLILLGLRALKRVLTNQRFTECEKVQKEVIEYEKINNPILGYFDEVGFDEILNEPTKKVYRKYQEFCIRNGLQPLSNIEFSRQAKRHFKLNITEKKINGVKYHIFTS